MNDFSAKIIMAKNDFIQIKTFIVKIIDLLVQFRFG